MHDNPPESEKLSTSGSVCHQDELSPYSWQHFMGEGRAAWISTFPEHVWKGWKGHEEVYTSSKCHPPLHFRDDCSLHNVFVHNTLKWHNGLVQNVLHIFPVLSYLWSKLKLSKGCYWMIVVDSRQCYLKNPKKVFVAVALLSW